MRKFHRRIFHIAAQFTFYEESGFVLKVAFPCVGFETVSIYRYWAFWTMETPVFDGGVCERTETCVTSKLFSLVGIPCKIVLWTWLEKQVHVQPPALHALYGITAR
jgi:hypothetical protein